VKKNNAIPQKKHRLVLINFRATIDTFPSDMKKNRLNTVLLLSLITALLSVQWSVTHVHLSKQHDHDRGLHHHSIEAHAHHPVSHHSDLIELSHQAGDTNVIELGTEYRLTNSTKQKKLPDTVQASFSQPPLVYLSKIKLSEIISAKPGYLYQHTVYLRGPPLIS